MRQIEKMLDTDSYIYGEDKVYAKRSAELVADQIRRYASSLTPKKVLIVSLKTITYGKAKKLGLIKG